MPSAVVFKKKHMYQDTILLSIKRQFTTDEAVQTVLKMMAGLQQEIGMLKCELAEAEDKVERIRTEKTLTKKEWMEQEMFEQIHKENNHLTAKIKEYKRVWKNGRPNISAC